MKKEMRYLVPGDYMADPAMTGKAVSKKTTMAIIST